MRIEPKRGAFITLEGIDGCGKSTQAKRLTASLAARLGPGGALWTFEPGGWQGGVELRRLLLSGEVPDSRTELLLFLADRSGHLESVVLPALSASKAVVCERYSDSTLAYQCWGRGVPIGFVRRMLDDCGFIEPDVTILLDIGVDEAEGRLGRRGRSDAIESGGRSFMERVAAGYRELARLYPGRIAVVDASRGVDEVAASVEAVVRAKAPEFGGAS